ncbi:MAG: ABC transporter permease subunit [Anaerolineae bacterium]|nr:ABC transporter permease subunit [Anaerolineae bacterium]
MGIPGSPGAASSVVDVTEHQTVPLWRDVRVIQVVLQIIFAVLAIAVMFTIVNNILNGLQAIGQSPNLEFWDRQFGINFSEGPGIESTDTTWQAFTVGLINTMRAVSVGLVLATVLGILVGIALLTPNWLVRTVTEVYVEIFRNTPLLVQLIFIAAIFRGLPQVRDAISLPGPLYLSNRGLVFPAFVPTDTFPLWLLYVVVGFVAAGVLWYIRGRYQVDTGQPGYQVRYAVLAIVGFAILGMIAVGGVPWTMDMPQPDLRDMPTGEVIIRRIEGGETISPEYAALVVGLVLYTAAFIGEIVRAGIQAVPHGQIEAARAQGFTYAQTLQLVILPQALRVIIPPLGNQYLNLAKNSSLAIAIAFQDVFAIARTIMNQSGQTIVPFITVMLVYLLISLVISAAMNWLNNALKLKER